MSRKELKEEIKINNVIQTREYFLKKELRTFSIKQNEKFTIYDSIIDNKKLEMSDASMPFDRLTIIYRKRKEYHKEIEVINKWIESLEKSNLIEERKSEEIEKLNQRLEKAKKLYQNKNN